MKLYIFIEQIAEGYVFHVKHYLNQIVFVSRET